MFCASDIVAGVCRGQVFEGAWVIIQLSNLMYDEMLVIIAWCWMMYVFMKIRLFFSKKTYFVISMPLILFTVLAISNPLTNFVFIIAPAIASGLQMYFYGLTTTQVGITVSVVMVFLAVQDGQLGQIQVDALTGLNNRRELTSYIDYKLLCNKEIKLTIIMIDLEHFKQVNDKYGHVMGDKA